MSEVSYNFVTSHEDHRQTQKLQDSPRRRNTRARTGPAIIDKERERGPGKEPAQVRRVADKAATKKADKQVDKDDRQHAGAKHALEAFRQLMTKFDPEDEQNTDQSK